MYKNPTPQQIAILASVSITAFIFLSYFLLVWPAWAGPVWISLVLWVGALLLSIYFITIFFLKNYIYRKIKVIYKTIHNHKISTKDTPRNLDISANIIDEVEREVNEWAVDQQRELDKYKSWAEYRRKFVGDISHELKTPIFNIQGYIHSLIDGGLEDPKVNRKFLEKAAGNLKRLNTIVEDLEAISRLESGELLLEMQTFDIRELALEVFEDLEFKARARNVSLELKDGASAAYRVRADRESIRQVLMNLVHNSIKYGVPDGVTKVGFYDMDKHILVEVADNGIGIPPNHLNHVFDRFYRVDKSRSRSQGGSGLGLSIVKHIIEAHNQTINVRSTPNLGSTFGFTLAKA